MTNTQISENPPYFDNEEREIMEAFEKVLDEGTLISHLTPERKTELQNCAGYTFDQSNFMDGKSEPAWRQELDKRIREIETGAVTCIPREEVREKLYRNADVE
uniref:Addiction module component n=1 Tax=Candidatus Kentrum sp. SD TaxID=2126332 RepID=A0A451BRN2_9GAMM|nr:MAG: Putative addiction module component [Candidatus Kentron sp. SD]